MATYCFDTSAFVEAWRRLYPPDVFPSYWQNLRELARTELICSPDEVLEELSRKEDDLYTWARELDGFFQPLDDQIQTETMNILAEFPRLVAELSDRTRADPFVIALAKRDGLTVVSNEKRVGSRSRPHIPNVCDALGVRHCDLLDFIRDRGWTF